MQIAIDEVNRYGGVDGLPLELELEDSATDPKTAVFAFEKLTAGSGVQVIVTEVSGVVLALAPQGTARVAFGHDPAFLERLDEGLSPDEAAGSFPIGR